MNKHIDNVHYNPVKHGYVRSPFEWEYSSIHVYKDNYQSDWGWKQDLNIDGEFGE